MFRCQSCQCLSAPHTPCHRLIVKSRRKEYPHRSKANIVVRYSPKDKKRKKSDVDDPGGVGMEIVQEIIVCPSCANEKDEDR